jgi:hypothetical protein
MHSLGIRPCLVALAAAGLPAAQAQNKGATGTSLSGILAQAPRSAKLQPGDINVTAKANAIVADHVSAAAMLYAAAALEDMQFFAVADRVADQFLSGKLPVAGSAKTALAKYVRERPQRLDASARSRMYSHVLGGSSTSDPNANADFAPLWARFLGAVHDYERQLSKKSKPTNKPNAQAASAVAVHDAARNLAVNLSSHGYGAVMFAAVELGRHVRELQALLSDPELLQSYQARDMWELIDRVAKQELGKTANVSRQRTLAASGSDVLHWLSTVAQPLESSGGAAKVATSLLSSRVPQAVRDLNRVLTPKQKLLAHSKTQVPNVRALCLDKKRRPVPCRVRLEK